MKFNKLLAVCAALSTKACSVIKYIHDIKAKNVVFKSFADPVT